MTEYGWNLQTGMREPNPWKTGEKEKNQKAVDDLNRARDLSELSSIFERLGIDKKLEELQPVLEEVRLRIRQGSMPSSDRDALRKLVEFIECIDEP